MHACHRQKGQKEESLFSHTIDLYQVYSVCHQTGPRLPSVLLYFISDVFIYVWLCINLCLYSLLLHMKQAS